MFAWSAKIVAHFFSTQRHGSTNKPIKCSEVLHSLDQCAKIRCLVTWWSDQGSALECGLCKDHFVGRWRRTLYRGPLLLIKIMHPKLMVCGVLYYYNSALMGHDVLLRVPIGLELFSMLISPVYFMIVHLWPPKGNGLSDYVTMCNLD